MIRNLENKVAWITGAGSGIGQDAAIKLSKLGMKVILSGRNIETLQDTASKCDKDTIELIGIDGDVAHLNKGNLTSSTEKKYSVYQHKKKYSPNRDLELYRMIKTGCTLTNDHLFNSAKKWL